MGRRSFRSTLPTTIRYRLQCYYRGTHYRSTMEQMGQVIMADPTSVEPPQEDWYCERPFCGRFASQHSDIAHLPERKPVEAAVPESPAPLDAADVLDEAGLKMLDESIAYFHLAPIEDVWERLGEFQDGQGEPPYAEWSRDGGTSWIYVPLAVEQAIARRALSASTPEVEEWATRSRFANVRVVVDRMMALFAPSDTP
jgi:hypothetical protein